MADIILPKNEQDQSPDGTIRESIQKALTPESAKAVAKHIVEVMRREADSEQLDFDFHITAATGEMAVASEYVEKNVWFKFDCKPDSELAKIKVIEFEANCNTDELDQIDMFNRAVCESIKNDFASEVEDILRERMFDGKKDMPVRLMQVLGFEMIDFSHVRPEENYTINVDKRVPRSEVDNTAPITEELFRIHIATGKGFNEIVKEKKEAGDINYKYVHGIETKKFLWECQVDFYVDFSADKPIQFEKRD